MDKSTNALERLEQVMAETARAVRSGDFASMAELAMETEAALSDLGPETDAARLTALRDMAQRNAAGLEAAGRGVRSARRRLAEIATVRAGGKTYGYDGKTQKIGAPLGKLKARF
ncbi:hypothetical protein [Pseudorhodobacter sp. E13]|uniref:hypothetical protein n=1 Tax=Pseudorhodobacter sp. E13 TaxID=2487931 RepID=UPI000F8D2986|nr:hypothetical protein [Pseudorhodobacter sp. E13]